MSLLSCTLMNLLSCSKMLKYGLESQRGKERELSTYLTRTDRWTDIWAPVRAKNEEEDSLMRKCYRLVVVSEGSFHQTGLRTGPVLCRAKQAHWPAQQSPAVVSCIGITAKLMTNLRRIINLALFINISLVLMTSRSDKDTLSRKQQSDGEGFSRLLMPLLSNQ